MAVCKSGPPSGMVPCGKVRYNDVVHKASSYYMEAHMIALSGDMVHSFATVKMEMATVIAYTLLENKCV
jgi:hypothetical protein